ncbi:MAG TPA: DNRLRE domain-containing protein [Vicinamibacterales bacterium]|nr:DNRLRE domain-containing protein [Vicinamibacterales bacterium]
MAVLGLASSALAQTTVTINQPKTQVVYATVRGGTYANKNLSTLLETRASDNPEYERRALLKFDTQNGVPSGSAVSSAILTMTVKSGSADATRRIGVYQVTQSFTETEVTWQVRKTSTSWTSAGGDLGSQVAMQAVGNTAGTKVSFDVTSIVKAAVAGQLGSSRYTRIALVDLDASTADSYRAYYTPDDANTSVRPVLKVTYGGSATASTTSSSTPSTSTTTSSTLRVLQYNTHHGGYGTDGVWDVTRLMKVVAKANPDVVSLNEVEYNDGYSHGGDDLALYLSTLKQLTGHTWYGKFVVGSGASSGIGNAILSKTPFDTTSHYQLSHGRAVLHAAITVNGRTINFFSTHLDANSTSYRLEEIGELTTYARGFSEQRIICGDFNAWPGSTENSTMKQSYSDSWAVAKAAGTGISAPDNPDGDTRNSRIDYVYDSHGAGDLVLKSVQVIDTRDSNGVMPSDHRPVLAIFGVK